MEESIEQRSRGCLNWQEVAPLFEGPMACQTEAAMLVRGCYETEQQLRTSLIQGSKPELIDEHQVIAQHGVDQFADGVVGESAVQRLDQIGSDEVAHAQTPLDSAIANTDQAMAFAGARGTHQ